MRIDEDRNGERNEGLRQEAHELALQDVKDEGLAGEEAEEYYWECKARHYEQLEASGMHGV